MSIKTKMAIWFISIAVLAGISSSMYSIYEDWAEAEERAVKNAESTARTIALAIISVDESAPPTPIYKSPLHIKDFVEDLHRLLKEDVAFVDTEEKVLGEAEAEEVGIVYNFDTNNEVGQTISDGITRTFIEKSGVLPGKLQLVVPAKTEDGETVGAVIIEYTHYYEEYIAEAKRGALYSSMSIFILLLVVGVIGYRVAVGLSKPIIDLKKASDEIAASKLDVKVEVESRDEIGDLAAAFNKMVALRKKEEDAVKESEDTLKATINATTDAMFLIDVEGNILALNETTALRLGKTKDELTGACIYDHLPPDIARSRRAYVNEAISSGKTVNFEDERNGEWVDNSIYPIFNEQGKVVKVAIYGRYITDRKKVEEELKRTYGEIQEKSDYLERFNRLMVGRELEMVRLKAEVNELLEKAGQPKKYEAPDEVKKGGGL